MTRSFFNKFRKNTPDKGIAIQKIEDSVEYSRSNPSLWDHNTMGNENDTEKRILDRLHLSISDADHKHRAIIKNIRLWSAAAILLVCIVAGIFKDELLDKIITYPQVLVEAVAAHQQKINLPDGSTVFLNAGTRLSFPKHFSHKVREVTLLEGEAYFDVKHDANKPFVVNADKTKTTVLGTSFNIRAYRFTPVVTVTVSSGKVAVNDKYAKQGKPYFLLPNQQITYAKLTGAMQTKEVKAQDAIGWMDGKLLFANEDFKQVVGLLENKYNVKIEFDNPALTSYHFTASFEASESLTGVLDDLTLTKGLRYTVKGRTIRIFHDN